MGCECAGACKCGSSRGVGVGARASESNTDSHSAYAEVPLTSLARSYPDIRHGSSMLASGRRWASATPYFAPGRDVLRLPRDVRPVLRNPRILAFVDRRGVEWSLLGGEYGLDRRSLPSTLASRFPATQPRATAHPPAPDVGEEFAEPGDDGSTRLVLRFPDGRRFRSDRTVAEMARRRFPGIDRIAGGAFSGASFRAPDPVPVRSVFRPGPTVWGTLYPERCGRETSEVSTELTAPEKWVCYNQGVNPLGITQDAGTSFIVGLGTYMTAAHVFYPDTGGAFSDVTLYAARRGMILREPGHTAGVVCIPENYFGANARRWDWAVGITNSWPTGYGAFPFGTLSDLALDGLAVSSLGYPGTPIGQFMYCADGASIYRVREKHIRYDIDTSPGWSGAPVFRPSAAFVAPGVEPLMVVGIHHFGLSGGNGEAMRITDDIMDSVASLEENWSSVAVPGGITYAS